MAVFDPGSNNCSSTSQFFYGILDPFGFWSPDSEACKKWKEQGEQKQNNDKKKDEIMSKINQYMPYVIVIIIIAMLF